MLKYTHREHITYEARDNALLNEEFFHPIPCPDNWCAICREYFVWKTARNLFEVCLFWWSAWTDNISVDKLHCQRLRIFVGRSFTSCDGLHAVMTQPAILDGLSRAENSLISERPRKVVSLFSWLGIVLSWDVAQAEGRAYYIPGLTSSGNPVGKLDGRMSDPSKWPSIQPPRGKVSEPTALVMNPYISGYRIDSSNTRPPSHKLHD